MPIFRFSKSQDFVGELNAIIYCRKSSDARAPKTCLLTSTKQESNLILFQPLLPAAITGAALSDSRKQLTCVEAFFSAAVINTLDALRKL